MCKAYRLGLLLALSTLLGAAGAAALSPPLPDVPIDTSGPRSLGTPVLAFDSAGGFTAVWSRGGAFTFHNEVWAQRFDRDGNPFSLPAQLDSPGGVRLDETVINLASDRVLALWVNDEFILSAGGSADKAAGGSGTVSARYLGADGQPSGAEFQLAGADFAQDLRAAPLPSGGFVASWVEYSPIQRAVLRFFNDDAQATSPEIELVASDCGLFNGGLGGTANGGAVAFWGTCAGFSGRRFGPNGASPDPVFSFNRPDSLAVRGDGSFVAIRTAQSPLTLPQASELDVYAQLYDDSGQPIGSEFLVEGGAGNQIAGSVAVGRDGGFVIVWSNDSPIDDQWIDSDIFARLYDAAGNAVGPASLINLGTQGDQVSPRVAASAQGDWGVSWRNDVPTDQRSYVRLFADGDPSCPATTLDLCLNGGRFLVAVDWREQGSGQAGKGRAVPLTGDTGAFWFFGPNNLELVVKVLDGRPVNGHFWVFYGALSDVEYTLRVTDRVTGETKSYRNPPGTMASRADTQAFAASGASAAASRLLASATSKAGSETLSLNADRFDVEVEWVNGATAGKGTAVPLTSDTGYFWFFADTNIELIVKVLDGRPVNGKFWVFYGALSDVEYTITVTDKVTGARQTYHNQRGTMASQADTDAFDG